MSAPASPPPFSLVEFGNLVALALDTDHASDRFLESFLQFDPDFLAPAIHNPTQLANKEPQFLAQSPQSGLTRTSSSSMKTTGQNTSTWVVSSPSRPRQFFDKIKRQASVFVLRTSEAEKPRSPANLQQTMPTFSPYSDPRYASGSSFFDDDFQDTDGLFAPFLPLASQYERAAAQASTLKKGRPTLAIFSRPPSLVTSPPPSPRSARSISTTSSGIPITPTTPSFTPENPPSPSDTSYNPRWSLCTDESSPSSTHSSSSVSYQNHPFSLPHFDPFAKGTVQVVRHSAHSQDGYNGYQQTSSKRRRHSNKKRRTAPAAPPPSGPLPTLPDPAALNSRTESRLKSKALHIPSTTFTGTTVSKVQDWTLSLPLNVRFPGSPSPPQSPSQLRSPSGNSPLIRPRVRTRSRSFLSNSSSSSDSHSSQCPSSWHPTPPPSTSHHPSPSPKAFRTSQSSALSSRSHRAPHPPRTADSTASTDSTATNESTDSTATFTQKSVRRQREAERQKALATLTGPAPSNAVANWRREMGLEAEADSASLVSDNSGTYYSARSSFTSAYSASFGTEYGCHVRVRVDSSVRP